MISKFLSRLFLFLKQQLKLILRVLLLLVVVGFLSLGAGKIYQGWDDDEHRGAVAIKSGAFAETYAVPEYLDQGWDESDSLWFYNTTQGSGLLPYDFFLVLKHADSDETLRSNKNMDRFRYLPQSETFFNPDALPVGFTKDTYQGKDYVGFTCAACHTAQINFNGKAVRIDGGPAMADMVGFLKELARSLRAARKGKKWEAFARDVLALDNDYTSAEQIKKDLAKWADAIELYNTVNHSDVEYGHARLDAFGRIFNRVLQHVINKEQVAELLAQPTADGKFLLNRKQIDKVLAGVGGTIILRDNEFAKIINRLRSKEDGYPGLGEKDFRDVLNRIFNPPSAPVSYPFLWDIAQSDYVQWNGLASNASAGPLARNAGEVVGVFGILDWQEDRRWLTRLTGFSLSALFSGQRNKRKQIRFKSSIDLFNLKRLESHLRNLKSPRWPFCRDGNGKYYIPEDKEDDPKRADQRDCRGQDKRFDKAKVDLGRSHYERLCLNCHEVIDREDWDRKVIANMSRLGKIGMDRAMATNSVKYEGKAGNLKHTYQKTEVGDVLVTEKAPVVEILSAATRGVIATPDPDKWLPRRWAEWIYTFASSIFDNEIKASVKNGNYNPDTTAEPYASLLAYKARSLNGIWATAPYLHNGSVPSLYDLLLPVKPKGNRKTRPTQFVVGAREFDPGKIGFKSEDYEGFVFKTDRRGNSNAGHEYGAGNLTEDQRLELLEYLKTL